MQNLSLINLINKKVLNYELRINLLIALIMVIISSLLEVVSIGAFLPFIEILLGGKEGLINNKIINESNYLKDIFTLIPENRIITYGIISFGSIIVLKNIITFFFHFYREHINYKIQTNLINRLFKDIIFKNFENFYKKNSSIYYNLLVRESGQTSHTINIFLHLFNEIFVLIFVISFLLLLNIKITLILISTFFLLSLPVYIFTKEKIKKMSTERISRDQNMIKNINESFLLFKYLKVNFLENFYLNLFNKNNFKSYNLQKKMSVLQFLPRYYLEAITVIVFSLILIFINTNQKSLLEILPVIAVFSFAGLRLLPLVKSLVMGLQEIKRGAPSIKSVCDELSNNKQRIKNFTNIKFKKINFDNLNFGYSKNLNLINNFNFQINTGDKIIIKGPSGSGKTTLVDILIGVKKKKSGNILIDDENISSNLFEKIKTSYVPQESYLIDDTLKNNIIFPVENLTEEDYDKVLKAVELKNMIKDFPDQENTMVGEKGYKISGGQKQRIIIARSLITKPEILVLDEATNALDMTSEDMIIKNIIENYRNMTVIIISHRNLDKNLFNKTINLGGK